jgi:hypothetical protein
MNQRFLHRSGPQLGRVDGDHVYNSSGSQLGVLTVSVFTVDLARLKSRSLGKRLSQQAF